MPADAVYLVAGLALLIAVVLPTALRRWAVSAPMVLLVVGMLIGLLPLPKGVNLDPIDIRPTIEHVSEVAILIALMGVGLALDRPLSLRDRSTFTAWAPTWRMLFLAMPLCIAAIFGLGWGLLGLTPAAALLLGSVLAPTDPVLAGDVQVDGPAVEPEESAIDEDDEVRFALTSEAGLNDGAAFPFVYAAIFLASEGSLADWGLKWVAWELVGKIFVGLIAGYAAGWVLGKVAFRAPAPSLRMAEQGQPLLALAAVLTAYGVCEVAGGYGFLAVFVCAMTIRSLERGHEYHRHMHEMIERLEWLFVLLILLFLGIELTRGLLGHLDWRGVVVALALVVVVRPVMGLFALRAGVGRDGECGGLDWRERMVVAFFGIRGIGSIYYLAYALGLASFGEERWLWSTVGFTIVLSVFVHGILVTPAMTWLERHGDPRPVPAGPSSGEASATA